MNNKLGGWAIGHNLYEWITNNLKKGSKILELGSGTGSHELGKIYDVYCVEHNEKWLNKFDNLTYYYAPIVNGWYNEEFLKHLPKHYDLLIIDGPPGNIGRENFINYKDHFRNDIPIIIDDTNRSAELNLCKKLNSFLNKEEIVITDRGKQTTILL